MRTPLLSSYIFVGAGLLLGAYVGIFVIEYDPPIMGWFFGTGTGLALGAFVAALATNTPLAGSASQPQRRGVIPRATPLDDRDDLDDVDDLGLEFPPGWDDDLADRAPRRR